MALGIVAVFLTRRTVRIEDLPPDDGSSCAACGNSDLEHPAEGVYRCRCGFEGGPELPEYEWQRRSDRISAMAEAERERMLMDAVESATLVLVAARSDYEAAHSAFTKAMAICPITPEKAQRKSELEEDASDLRLRAEKQLFEAVSALETARHILRGDGRMTSWYEKLNTLRDAAVMRRGTKAAAQLRRARDVLVGLERELKLCQDDS